MQEEVMVRSKGTLLALSLYIALAPGALFAATNGPEGEETVAGAAPAAAGPATSANEGHFICTAAINAAGGVFSGQYVNGAQTGRVLPAAGGLAAGAYQVAFNAPCSNVQIANGWFRICQIDTLTTGTIGGYCTVADRYGVPSAVWVETFNAAGAPTNLPFTLSVSR
jgi:hypothetical protein